VELAGLEAASELIIPGSVGNGIIKKEVMPRESVNRVLMQLKIK